MHLQDKRIESFTIKDPDNIMLDMGISRFALTPLNGEVETWKDRLYNSVMNRAQSNKYNQMPDGDQFNRELRNGLENDGQTNRSVETSVQFIIFIVFVLLGPLVPVQGKSNLEVNVVNRPVVFGKKAQLECIHKLNSEPRYMSWTKIPAGETIAVGTSSTHRKYKVNISFESGIMRYHLTIEDFSLMDLREYKCYMDFVSNSTTLQLNEKEFVAIPKELKVKKNSEIRNGKLTGRLSLISVYPQPKCEAFFEKESITDQLHVVNTKDPVLFTTDIQIEMFTELCNGNLFVNCTVGANQQLVHPYQRYVNSCPEYHDVDSIKIIVSVVCVGIVIIAIVLAAFLWTKTRKIRGTRTKELRKNIAQMNAHNGTKQWRKEVVTTEAQDDCENTPMNC